MNTNSFPQESSTLGFIQELYMQAQLKSIPVQTPTTRKLSQQMRAVLIVFNADSNLMKVVRPHIDLERESIDWERINDIPLCKGHRSAIGWAFALWRDEKPKINCFDGALSMSSLLKVAVLEALCLRWGLRG